MKNTIAEKLFSYYWEKKKKKVFLKQKQHHEKAMHLRKTLCLERFILNNGFVLCSKIFCPDLILSEKAKFILY